MLHTREEQSGWPRYGVDGIADGMNENKKNNVLKFDNIRAVFITLSSQTCQTLTATATLTNVTEAVVDGKGLYRA